MNLNKYIIDLDQYRSIKSLGKGTFGEVFLVEDTATKKLYAAKVSNKPCTKTNDQKIFFNEIEILMSTNNPAILKIVGFNLCNFSSQPFPTILLEYLPNGSLAEMIEKVRDKKSPIKWNDTKKYINLLGIAIGMKYLHSRNIVQRDLKPLNVLLDENYYPHISDFGHSKMLDELNSANLMSTGIGTLIYMAPEILTGSEYNYKVDVYSYAIVAYEILTSRSPISKGENPMAFIYKVPNGRRPDTSMITNKIQIEFLEKCWSNDPNNRPSFAQIVDILRDRNFYSKLKVNEKEINDYINLFDDKILINNSDPVETKANIAVIESNEIKTKTIPITKAPTTKESNKIKTKTIPIKSMSTKEESTKKKSEIRIRKDFFKVVLIGDKCSKKTRIVNTLFNDIDDWDHTSTIGAAFNQKEIRTELGKCTLRIWDSAGQEKYRALAPMYLRDSSAIIITINANVENQFESLQMWLDFIESNKVNPLIYIAAINCIEGCVVDPQTIYAFAKDHGFQFFPIAFDNDSIKLMFEKIATNIMEMHQNDQNDEHSNGHILEAEEPEKHTCIIY